MSKPREFWICELLNGELLIFREEQSGRTKFIEYSAYETLRLENERLKYKIEEANACKKMMLENETWLEKQLQSEHEKNKFLEAKNRVYKDAQLRTYDGLSQRADMYEAEKEKVTKLRAALEFYATSATEVYEMIGDGPMAGMVAIDNGDKARSVLAEIGDEK